MYVVMIYPYVVHTTDEVDAQEEHCVWKPGPDNCIVKLSRRGML